MGSIKLGTNTITNVKFGNTQVAKVYLGTNLIWTSSAPSYSAELNAIIARANTEGFTLPSSATLTAIDALITALKTDAVPGTYNQWDFQDRIYNFAYNDTALTNFSRIDWRNPSTSPLITINGGITYVVGGFQGNGTDGYLDTNFVPVSDAVYYYTGDANRTMWVYTVPTTGTAIDGNTQNNNRLFNVNSAGQNINCLGALSSSFDMSGGGLKIIDVTSSSTVYLLNRTTYSTRSWGSPSTPTVSQHILRINTGYSNIVVSMHMMGYDYFNTPSSGDLIRTAYNTYLSAVGLTPNTDS